MLPSCVRKYRLELRLDFTLWSYGRRTIIETPAYLQSVRNRTKEMRAEPTLTWNFSGGKKVNVRRGTPTASGITSRLRTKYNLSARFHAVVCKLKQRCIRAAKMGTFY